MSLRTLFEARIVVAACVLFFGVLTPGSKAEISRLGIKVLR
jgi:hypothetical protein